jgi:hypothetical protein
LSTQKVASPALRHREEKELEADSFTEEQIIAVFLGGFVPGHR